MSRFDSYSSSSTSSESFSSFDSSNSGHNSTSFDPHGIDLQSMIQMYPADLFENQQQGHSFRRPLNERLFYSTGTSYLIGIGAGGLWGLAEGLLNKEATSFRLKVNSVLNAMTRRGPLLGNSAAVVVMMYHLSAGGLERIRNHDDKWNSIAAGSMAGLIFKSTAGVRPAAAATVLGDERISNSRNF